MSIWDIIASAESSGGRNVNGPFTSSGQAQGIYQITTGTWQDYARRAGVDLGVYPTPNSAPFGVQQAVASNIPLNRWDPRTVQAVEAAYGGTIDPSQTLGTIAQGLGDGGAGTGTAPGGSTSGQGCGFSPGCWFSALGSFVGGYATRAVLVVVGIIFLVGAMYLFATRTQAMQAA